MQRSPRLHRLPWLVGLAVVALAAATCAGSSRATAPSEALAGVPLVVVESPDAAGWVRLLRVSGAAAREGSLEELLERAAGVVGSAADLDDDDVDDVVSWVRAGGRLVTDDDALLAALDVGRDRPTMIDSVEMDGVAETAFWPEAQEVAPLAAGSVEIVAASRSRPLAGSARRGEGGVFALAVDPLGGELAGYELLPTLGRTLRTWTGAPPGPERNGVQLYLDPGTLPDQLVADPVALAARLSSVQAVHLAGWNADYNDPADNFDYASLLSALHAEGVLVYAWLEPPFVSLRFWDRHPECREQTFDGEDAHVDWRRLIALEDEDCFKEAMKVYGDLVSSFDFDGVNVAELYFESAAYPERFTPFHPSMFERFLGYPPSDLDAFLDFRTDLVTTLNEAVLLFLNGLERADELDLQLTVIDDDLDAEHARLLGSDTDALAGVARRQGATLQLEDPFTQWEEGPLRYDELGPALEAWRDIRAFIDINVVDRERARPTDRMISAELDLAVGSAAAVPGQVAVYSAATVDDVGLLDDAAAGAAATGDWVVDAPWTVAVAGPPGADTRLEVDGRPWPVAEGRAFLPAGRHELAWAPGPTRGPALLRLTAELGEMSGDATHLQFRYSSRGRGYAVVSAPPLEVDSTPRPGGGWTVSLPAGNHEMALRFAP